MESNSSWGSLKPNLLIGLLLKLTNTLPRNYVGRRVFFFLRRILRFGLGGSSLDVVRLGAKLRIKIGGNVCEGRILFNQDYFDFEERKFLRDHLPSNAVFIDAGANIGGYSFDVASSLPDARVIAIEAHPETFARLKFNAENNPEMRIAAFNCALAAENGMVTLFTNDMNAGENSTRIVNGNGSSLTVAARTLSDVLQGCDIKHVDALKIDIEGAEDEVLRAFFENADVALFPTYILIEKSADRWDYDVVEFLTRLGYGIMMNFRNNLILQRS